MQWGVDQANDDWIALASFGIDHRGEDALKVAALEWQQLVEGGLAFLLILRQDHLLYDGQAFLLHEHVLGATEADAFRAEGHSALCIARIVCVGPHAEPAVLVRPTQQLLQIDLFLIIGIDRLDDAREYFSGRAVDGDIVALAEHNISPDHAHQVFLLVDADTLAAGYAG